MVIKRFGKNKNAILPLKLQRFLMTLARRDGIQRIEVGVIVVLNSNVNNNFVLLNAANSFPSRVIDDDSIETALKSLIKEIGMTNSFSATYLGSFDYYNENGVLTRRYMFKVQHISRAKSTQLKPLSQRLHSDLAFRFVNIEEALHELANGKEARILRSLLNRSLLAD
jgi:hypothetical protein